MAVPVETNTKRLKPKYFDQYLKPLREGYSL